MTPWANAAARVPPPEKASATTVLPLTSGGTDGGRMAAAEATWTLIGSRNVVVHDASRSPQATSTGKQVWGNESVISNAVWALTCPTQAFCPDFDLAQSSFGRRRRATTPVCQRTALIAGCCPWAAS